MLHQKRKGKKKKKKVKETAVVNCTEWLQGEPAEQQQQQQSVPRPIWCPRAREGAPENSSVSKIKFAYLLSLFAFSPSLIIASRSLLPAAAVGTAEEVVCR